MLNRIVTALGITQIIGWGTTFYVPAVLAARMSDDTGWSPTLVLAAFSWCMLVSGLISKRAGALIDRIGARVVMSWGSVALAAGLLLVATAHHPAQLFLGWTVIGIGMRAALYDAAFAALAALAGTGARRSISIVTLWGGLASTFFWPIGHALGEAIDWRQTLLVYAALNLLVCLPLHRLLPARGPLHEARAPNAPAAAAPAQAPAADVRLSGVQRERLVLLLSAVFAGHALVWSSLSAHLIPVLHGMGLAAGIAVSLSTIIGVAQVGSRLLELFAQRRLAPMATGVLATGMLALALVLLWLGPVTAGFVAACCVIYGAANGLVTIVRGALPLVLFGQQGYGEVLGRLAAPGLVASALAPVLFSSVLERTGPTTGLGLLAAIALASFAGLVWVVRRARRSAAGG